MKKFSYLLVAAGLLLGIGLATPVSALSPDFGEPIAPHGYPAWYQDENGLQLELCVPPPAGNASRPELCIFPPLALDVNDDLVLDGESFWWLASSSVAMPGGGDALLEFAIEGTYGGNGAAVNGQQISFGRTRIRIDTPVTGPYTVIHPYGTREFIVTDADAGIRYVSDIGAANFLDPAKGFSGTLAAPIGPFLTWPDYATNPDLQVRALDPDTGEPTDTVLEQYVGNPNLPNTVVGGPNGNVFRVVGPGGIVVETDLFSVMGKVFDPTVAAAPHDFPPTPTPNLFDVGPINLAPPVINETEATITGYAFRYPIWYQEKVGTPEAPIGGLQLTLCTPGDVMCISDPINQAVPAQSQLLTGGEGFWWSADARIELPAGRAQLGLALEATFGGDESLIDGQQIAFGRVRLRIPTAQAGTYRVTHPYATQEFVVTDVAAGINYTADIGIADPADPDGAFVGALYSDIGPTFLKWETFNEDPLLTDPLLVTVNAANPLLNNYHVGNPAFLRPVKDGPNGNRFRIEYLQNGSWVLVGQTDLFAISGKIFDESTYQFFIDLNAPGAVDDEAALDMATASFVSIPVLANDTGAEGAPPVLFINTPPENGSVVITSNLPGTISYTPSAEFALTGGVDTFTYQFTQTINGVVLASRIATVTVTVIPVEAITVQRANFNTRHLRLDLRGNSNFPATTLSIYSGASSSGPLLGTVRVDANGRWRFRGTATTPVTSVTLVSNSAGATTVTQSLLVR